MLTAAELEGGTRMRVKPASRVCLLALALALADSGCQSSYSGERDAAGRQRIYQIPETEAFAITRESLAEAIPGAVIEEYSGPALRYPARGYRAVVSSTGPLRTSFDAFPLRAQGKTRAGEIVTGYYLRVRSVSSSFLGQDATTQAIAHAFEKRSEKTHKGVWVKSVRRLQYESMER